MPAQSLTVARATAQLASADTIFTSCASFIIFLMRASGNNCRTECVTAEGWAVVSFKQWRACCGRVMNEAFCMPVTAAWCARPGTPRNLHHDAPGPNPPGLCRLLASRRCLRQQVCLARQQLLQPKLPLPLLLPWSVGRAWADMSVCADHRSLNPTRINGGVARLLGTTSAMFASYERPIPCRSA